MFFGKKHKVIVKNKNITIEARSGSNLFKVLKENGIELPILCDGSGQCGKCKVHISSDNIQKPTKKERLILAMMSLEEGYRLACQYLIKSDIVVNTEDYFDKGESFDSTIKVKVLEQEEDTINKIDEQKSKESELQTEPIKAKEIETNKTHEKEEKIHTEEISEVQNKVEQKNSESIITSVDDNNYILTDGILLIQ
jgi:ferredoxin